MAHPTNHGHRLKRQPCDHDSMQKAIDPEHKGHVENCKVQVVLVDHTHDVLMVPLQVVILHFYQFLLLALFRTLGVDKFFFQLVVLFCKVLGLLDQVAELRFRVARSIVHVSLKSLHSQNDPEDHENVQEASLNVGHYRLLDCCLWHWWNIIIHWDYKL